MDQCLNWWLLKISNIAGNLSWLLVECNHLRINCTECVDDHLNKQKLLNWIKIFYYANLAFYRLNRIHNHGDCTFRKCLKTLLGVYVNARKPTTKSGMRVVPTNDHFWATSLFQHVNHFGLEYRIHSFNRYTLKIQNQNVKKLILRKETVPDCGIANTSMTLTVKSSTNSPNIRPIT